jgi:[ribosomal protein S18]-alanine N-acetyltransferase
VNRRLQSPSRLLAGPLSMLHRACFPEDPWDSLAIAEIMNITGYFGRIAWADQTPVGFVLALNLRQEYEILSLGVLPERRREGIASTLLDSVCSEGRVCGAEYIVLEVAVDNSAALALYTSRGFRPVGHRRNYYHQASRRVDALVLRLALANIMI